MDIIWAPGAHDPGSNPGEPVNRNRIVKIKQFKFS